MVKAFSIAGSYRTVQDNLKRELFRLQENEEIEIVSIAQSGGSQDMVITVLYKSGGKDDEKKD